MAARILLVEDDPVSRDILSSLLICRDYEVDTAEDGFSALRCAQDKAYDLVFIDYHLPEMDGYALARLMRTLGEKTETKFKMVAITADRFGLAARRGVDSVFDNILTKPINPEQLYACVAEILVEPVPSTANERLCTDEGQNAAHALWRARGFSKLPIAAVFPDPKGAERASLEYCFRIASSSESDCLLLMRTGGLPDIEAIRTSGQHFLQPLFTLDEGSAGLGDASFKIGDGSSWSAMAASILGFRKRRTMLPRASFDASTIEKRIATYLFVAERPLLLCRDARGCIRIPYTAGFSPNALLDAVKSLAKIGHLAVARGVRQEDGARELLVELTPKGRDWVTDSSKIARPIAG